MVNDPKIILAKDRVVEGEQPWHVIGAVASALLLIPLNGTYI
jgi:hypothetical protein